MARSKKKADKFFLYITFALIGVGIAMFASASLSILAKDQKLFYSVLSKQVLGLVLGLIGMYITYRIDYKIWRKFAFFILIAGLLITAAVFIPSLGIYHGGAQRWLSLGPISLQPAEILKFSFVIYFAAWLNWMKDKAHKFKFGLLPFFIILTVIGAILLKQPDTKSFILISITGISMLLLSGVPWKSIFLTVLVLGVALAGLVYFKPYLKDRITAYIDPSTDQLDTSYQIKQSLIAVGSGGILGRGYGQSVQKFTYLPEAQGDSIFAVLGEEFGFVGTLTMVILYSLFVLRGLKIASRSPDLFSRLLVSGIVILIGAQAFMHIAAIIGVFPLTGVPLPFMSHGGTSLMIYLSAVGIVFQISKLQGKSA